MLKLKLWIKKKEIVKNEIENTVCTLIVASIKICTVMMAFKRVYLYLSTLTQSQFKN